MFRPRRSGYLQREKGMIVRIEAGYLVRPSKYVSYPKRLLIFLFEYFVVERLTVCNHRISSISSRVNSPLMDRNGKIEKKK